MKKLIYIGLLICTYSFAQTRTWSAEERWANLTGEEALLLANVSAANAANVPSYLKADGAIVWAINEGILSSDNANYLDTRNLVSSLKTSLGSAQLPFSTTSPNDAIHNGYNVYTWTDIKDASGTVISGTPRVNLAIRVQPGGNRHLRTTQGRNEVINRILNSNNDRVAVRISRTEMLIDNAKYDINGNFLAGQGEHPSNGTRSVLQPGHFDVLNDGSGNYVFPSFEDWKIQIKADLKDWATYLSNNGVSNLDLVILDTEVRAWEPQHINASQYAAIQNSLSWPALSLELFRYGYDVNSTPTGSLKQRAVWNYVLNQRQNEAIAYTLEGIREVFPNVKFSEYAQRGLTGRHFPFASGWFIYYGWGGPGNIVGDYTKGDYYSPEMYGLSTVQGMPWGNIYPRYRNGLPELTDFSDPTGFDVDWRDDWETFIFDMSKHRGGMASVKSTLMPWISSEQYITINYNNAIGTDYWRENIFHLAVNGAEDWLWYNQDDPQDLAILESTLQEAADKLPYIERRQLTVEPVFYDDAVDYFISGCDTGGKLIYRVSWNPDKITDPANQITWPDGVIEYDSNGVGAWVVDEPLTGSLVLDEGFEDVASLVSLPHTIFFPEPFLTGQNPETGWSASTIAREGQFSAKADIAFANANGRERVEGFYAYVNGEPTRVNFEEEYRSGYAFLIQELLSGFMILSQLHAVPQNQDFNFSASSNGYTLTVEQVGNQTLLTIWVASDPSKVNNNDPGANSDLVPYTVPINLNEWNDFVVHHKFSTDNDGFFIATLNDVEVVRIENQPVGYLQGENGPNEPYYYMKRGVYTGTDPNATGIVLYDAERLWRGVGSTHQDVAPRGPRIPVNNPINPNEYRPAKAFSIAY